MLGKHTGKRLWDYTFFRNCFYQCYQWFLKIKGSLFFQNVFVFHFSTLLQELSLLSLIIMPYDIKNRQLLLSQIGRGSDNSLNLIQNKPKILSKCQFQNLIFVNNKERKLFSQRTWLLFSPEVKFWFLVYRCKISELPRFYWSLQNLDVPFQR